MAEIEKTFDYYHSRVLEIVRLCNKNFDSLDCEKEKIKNLLGKYEGFSQHNSFLVSAVKDLIL